MTGNSAGKGMISSSSTPWPAVLRRAHADGHQLASHTWTHHDLDSAPDELRATELEYNEMAFRDVFGFFPAYMRPPYASCYGDCLGFVGGLGYHVVNFNVDTKDYAHDSPDLIETSKRAFAAALGGGSTPTRDSFVVLVHDTHRQTVANLTRFMIDTIRAEGYEAVTVGDCLGDPAGNWYRNATSSAGVVARAASPDATCARNSGDQYTCDGSAYGPCCSRYGFW